MEAIEHRTVNVNGINMHIAEMGPINGPVILFIHGFPEIWYTWRHQIVALASQGYRAVAPDMRGYGDTDSPKDPRLYSCFHIVGDLIALMDSVAPNQESIFVVGHDWGALIAWYLCLFRPDKVKALVNLSVAFWPRDPNSKPIPMLRETYGDDYYMVRFQEYGDIESEFAELGTERVVKEFLTNRNPGPILLPKGKASYRPPGNPIVLPSWLSEEDVHYYTTKFEMTGFTGGVNYYRNLDRNWELMAPWTGAKVKVPVKFIVGDQDLTYYFNNTNEYIANGEFKKDVLGLEEVVILKGVAHFLNQEKSDEINKHISDFFRKF